MLIASSIIQCHLLNFAQKHRYFQTISSESTRQASSLTTGVVFVAFPWLPIGC
jgi:hypothetical protein